MNGNDYKIRILLVNGWMIFVVFLYVCTYVRSGDGNDDAEKFKQMLFS